MEHVRPDYKPWEQLSTCVKCAHPLDDNQRMKDAWKTNNVAAWAKEQLHILAETAADRGDLLYAREAQRISDGILLMPSAQAAQPAQSEE